MENVHWILILLLHILTVGGIACMLLGLFRMIWEENTNFEKVIQFACIVLSFFLFIILTYFDFSFIEKLFRIPDSNNLDASPNKGKNAMLLFNFIFGLVCSIFSYWLMQIISQSIKIKRFSIFLFSMLIIVFIQLYIKSWSDGAEYLVVGSCFLSGVIIYLVFILPHDGVMKIKGILNINNTSTPIKTPSKSKVSSTSFFVNAKTNQPKNNKNTQANKPAKNPNSASDQIINKLK